jgi:ADP-ribosyltransferase exoenzyme
MMSFRSTTLFLALSLSFGARAQNCTLLLSGLSGAAAFGEEVSKIPLSKFDQKFCQALPACQRFTVSQAQDKELKGAEDFVKGLPDEIAAGNKLIAAADLELKKIKQTLPLDLKALAQYQFYLRKIQNLKDGKEMYLAAFEKNKKTPEKKLLIPFYGFKQKYPTVETFASIYPNAQKSLESAKTGKAAGEKLILEYSEKQKALVSDPVKNKDQISSNTYEVAYQQNQLLRLTTQIEALETFLKDPLKEFKFLSYEFQTTNFSDALKDVRDYTDPTTPPPPNCSQAEMLYQAAQETTSSNKAGTCGLSPAELVMLKYYSDSGYGCMNQYLRQKEKVDADLDFLVKTLNSGLGKLPDYKGLVRRGGTLPQQIRDAHVPGAIITYDSFTSTSTSGGFGGSDLFMIYSDSGKPIMGFSEHTSENEVLFRSMAQFKILSVKKDGPVNQYVMKELLPGKTKEQEAAQDQKLLAIIKAQESEPVKNKYAWDKWKCPLQNDGKIPKMIPQKTVPGFKKNYDEDED